MTFSELADSFDVLSLTVERYWVLTACLGLGLFLIHIFNLISGRRLNYFGIIPRNIWGLPGVIFSPLLHQDFSHLFFNLFPLLILTNLVLIKGVVAYLWITGLLILSSGFLTWLLGRRAIHIGASSLIMGYWGFLLMSLSGGLSITSLLTVFICIYYFGYFIFSILPQGASGEEGSRSVSWEGHLFGLIAGILLGAEWFIDHGKILIAIVNYFYVIF